jgi:transcriptional regulator with XRE-family HTH domain
MGHLAGVVRALRDDAAVTQEELAERAGLSARTVSDIERGLRTRLYRDTAERLGSALGLTGASLEEFVSAARGRAAAPERSLDARFRHRFVAWHVDRVAALSGHVGHEEEWYAVLDADEANLSVALRWAGEDGDAESLLQLGVGLFRYWQARGDLAVGRQWLEQGLAAVPEASAPTRMTALWALGWLAFQQGDVARAAACADELAGLAEELDDDVARRNAATVQGMVALARDDTTAAVRRLGDALELAHRLEQPWLLATSLLNLAMARVAEGALPEARALLGEALAHYAVLGDERFRARSLGYLGLASLVEHDAARGASLYAQSLTLFAAVGESKGIAEALTGLATAAAITGRSARAALLAGAAERMRESLGGGALPVERRLAERSLAQAQSLVEEQDWREEWTRGRALRTDEVIELGLALPPS